MTALLSVLGLLTLVVGLRLLKRTICLADRQLSHIRDGQMSRVYRQLAVLLILLGLLVMFWALGAAISDVMHTYSPYAIRCEARGCRSILMDGSLADDKVSHPGGTR